MNQYQYPTNQASAAPAKFQFEFNPHTVMIALRCWWKVAVPMSIFLSLVAGGVVIYLHKPEYTSTAELMMNEKSLVILTSQQEDTRRFIENQTQIIRSRRLLTPLTSKPSILATPELEKAQDPTAALARQLTLQQKGKSDIYQLSFTSTSAEKAQVVVDAVVEEYLAFNRKMESEQDNQIIRLLEDQRVTRYEEMNQLRENVRTLSVQLTGVDPFRANSNKKDAETVKTDTLMANLQREIVADEVAMDILAAEVKAEESRLNDEIPQPSSAEIERAVEEHPQYLALKEKMAQLQLKESDFLKLSKNLEGNKLYEELRKELKDKSDSLDELRDRLRTEISESAVKQASRQRMERLSRKRAELATLQTRLKVRSDKFKDEIGKAKQFAGESLELEFRKAKLEQVTEVHDKISARILAITTEQRAPERVKLFHPASKPLYPNEPPLKKMALAAAVAFMLPLALAVAWEHLFRRVSSRSQVESTNQISIVGEVTSLPTKKRQTSLSTKRIDNDVLLFEESVDSLRTYLSLVESLQGLRVLAVTSAVSGEGKTSLAAQLAVSIARATNERTLLIDGDMRSPDMHDIFGIDLGPGLVDVLKGKCPIEEAIDTSFSESLHVLTAGKLTSSPHRLLSNNEFGTLIEKLGRIYRHIVIDTPPILPASESLVLSRAADSTVFCMRRDYSRIDQTQEAYSRMLAAGVKSAGAVLNGIPVQQYANRYGSYYYNRHRGENEEVTEEA
jgi:capsular exopolysaccharide synthesis family protein